jgi:hypothetical protein
MSRTFWYVSLSLVLSVSWIVPRPLEAAKVTVEIAGGDNVTFVGAFQRWDQDGNLVKKVNPKAKIEQPEVDAVATKASENQWVFSNLKPAKYDLVILAGQRVRIEGWEYAPVLEFDPFFPPTATVEEEETRDFVLEHIRKSQHYENKVEPLYAGGDKKAVRILVMLIRDKMTSFESDFAGAATMRFEIWQYSWNYGGWVKEKRTRVMHRVIMHRDELRKWKWLWDPKLGAVEVGKSPLTIRYQMPSPSDKKLKGLYPY